MIVAEGLRCGLVGEDAIARFWKENGFILKMILLFLLPVMPFWFFWPVMLTWMSM